MSAADLLLDSAEELYADDDERLSLQLNDLTSDDAGLYTCRAFNKAGAVNFTYTIHVTGKAQIPLYRLPRDVRDKPVTSHLAHIPSRRLPRPSR